MNLLYNSDSYAVVQIELGADADAAGGTEDARTESPDDEPADPRGGYEIVDKFARINVYLDGAVARSFRAGVQALSDGSPSVDEMDDYIAGFTVLAQQPVILH